MPKEYTVTARGEEITFTSNFETLDEAAAELVARGNPSKFARELLEKHHRYGLSDKQAAWVHKMASEEPREQREPLALGLTNIVRMLEVMPGKGKRKLQIADGIEVSLNGPRSKNPGHVSVTDGGPYKDNTYYGRIDDEGTVYTGRDFTDQIQQALVSFNNQGQEATDDDFNDDAIPF